MAIGVSNVEWVAGQFLYPILSSVLFLVDCIEFFILDPLVCLGPKKYVFFKFTESYGFV